ncbi:MAG: thiamine diphosphokinase, partial [Oscillospiraceae bacterium]
YDHLKNMGITPNLAIGDFDSAENIPIDTETIVLNSEKDVTDTFFASQLALKKGYKEIVYMGMLGGRFDHSFANIQTLGYLLDNGAMGHIYGDNTYITAIRNSDIMILPQKNKYLSVFCMGEKAEGVNIKNAKYRLENYTLRNNYPIGISNEFTNISTYIEVKNGTIIIMIVDK